MAYNTPMDDRERLAMRAALLRAAERLDEEVARRDAIVQARRKARRGEDYEVGQIQGLRIAAGKLREWAEDCSPTSR